MREYGVTETIWMVRMTEPSKGFYIHLKILAGRFRTLKASLVSCLAYQICTCQSGGICFSLPALCVQSPLCKLIIAKSARKQKKWALGKSHLGGDIPSWCPPLDILDAGGPLHEYGDTPQTPAILICLSNCTECTLAGRGTNGAMVGWPPLWAVWTLMPS